MPRLLQATELIAQYLDKQNLNADPLPDYP